MVKNNLNFNAITTIFISKFMQVDLHQKPQAKRKKSNQWNSV